MSDAAPDGVSLEAQVEELVKGQVRVIDPKGRELLSKVLFPDTMKKTVTILGKDRELRPLVIKWAKKLEAEIRPFAEETASAITKVTELSAADIASYDIKVVDGTLRAGRILGEAYGWEDIAKACAEEEIALPEVQDLIHTQVRLNGTSDFLLAPCRMLVMLMKIPELIETTLYSNMSISLPSPEAGTPPSKS